MPTKVAKKLPKRVGNTNARARRERSWRAGEERKRQRQARQDAQHAANVKAGKTPKVRLRPRSSAANFRKCVKCEVRRIRIGSVCVCRTLPRAGK